MQTYILISPVILWADNFLCCTRYRYGDEEGIRDEDRPVFFVIHQKLKDKFMFVTCYKWHCYLGVICNMFQHLAPWSNLPMTVGKGSSPPQPLSHLKIDTALQGSTHTTVSLILKDLGIYKLPQQKACSSQWTRMSAIVVDWNFLQLSNRKPLQRYRQKVGWFLQNMPTV